MSMFDEIESKAKAAMADPNERAKIEQIAKKEGMSMEDAAKKHLMHKNPK